MGAGMETREPGPAVRSLNALCSGDRWRAGQGGKLLSTDPISILYAL